MAVKHDCISHSQISTQTTQQSHYWLPIKGTDRLGLKEPGMSCDEPFSSEGKVI